MTVKNVGNTNLDDILTDFSVYGAYHRKIAFLVFIAFISNSISCMNYLFVAESVDYSCKPSDCDVVTHQAPEACVSRIYPDESCSLTNVTLEKCRDWVYEDPNSFVAEFGIACEEWKRNFVGTAHSIGYMIGLLIVGPISDRIGRKNTLILTGMIGGVMGVSKSFITNYWLYIVFEFLESCIGDVCSPIFMLAIEIVTTTNRPIFYMIAQFGYPAGGILFALISWGVPYFRNRILIIYIPSLFYFLYYFFIDESPRWLLTKGKKEQAVNILEKAARTNRINIDKAMLNNLSYEEESKTIGFAELIKITFKSKVILKRFLICWVWWATCTFTSYGLSLNSVALDGNKYINYIWVNCADIIGGVLTGYFMEKMSRKLALFWPFLAGAVLLMSQPFLPTNLTWLAIAFYMGGKAMCSLFFNITYVYTSELFPTYTRNSMHALCSSLGRVGSIVATQTPLLLSVWPGLPAFLFGGACLIAALTTLLVPDTGDTALPDTVEQAEKVGEKEVNLQIR